MSARPHETGLDAHAGHRRWVRLCHGALALAVLSLMASGLVILAAHPRLYWGEAGNALTPSWLDLPFGPNHPGEGWIHLAPIGAGALTADRPFEIFNQNGWARSLHFLAAWLLVATGALYMLLGIASGHLRRALLPRLCELTPSRIWRDVAAHLRAPTRPAPAGPPYGLLQKLAYCAVVFGALPAMVLTGLAMAPAVAAAWPALPALFGGAQSARSIHFLMLCALVLFVIVHLAMTVRTGLRRQLRAMLWGR